MYYSFKESELVDPFLVGLRDFSNISVCFQKIICRERVKRIKEQIVWIDFIHLKVSGRNPSSNLGLPEEKQIEFIFKIRAHLGSQYGGLSGYDGENEMKGQQKDTKEHKI